MKVLWMVPLWASSESPRRTDQKVGSEAPMLAEAAAARPTGTLS
jgi:hypothetical protein